MASALPAHSASPLPRLKTWPPAPTLSGILGTPPTPPPHARPSAPPLPRNCAPPSPPSPPPNLDLQHHPPPASPWTPGLKHRPLLLPPPPDLDLQHHPLQHPRGPRDSSTALFSEALEARDPTRPHPSAPDPLAAPARVPPSPHRLGPRLPHRPSRVPSASAPRQPCPRAVRSAPPAPHARLCGCALAGPRPRGGGRAGGGGAAAAAAAAAAGDRVSPAAAGRPRGDGGSRHVSVHEAPQHLPVRQERRGRHQVRRGRRRSRRGGGAG